MQIKGVISLQTCNKEEGFFLFCFFLLEHSHYLQYYNNYKYKNITYKHNVPIKLYKLQLPKTKVANVTKHSGL